MGRKAETGFKEAKKPGKGLADTVRPVPSSNFAAGVHAFWWPLCERRRAGFPGGELISPSAGQPLVSGRDQVKGEQDVPMDCL
jgi:hypothetical protein